MMFCGIHEGTYMEQGSTMTAAGQNDLHGKCQQLEKALQHAQVTPLCSFVLSHLIPGHWPACCH